MKFSPATAVTIIAPALAGLTLGVLSRGDISPPNIDKDNKPEPTLRSAAVQKPDPRFADRLATLTASDFEALIVELRRLPAHQRDLAINVALAHWAKVDPQAAANYAYGDPPCPVPTRKDVYRISLEGNFDEMLASLTPESDSVKILVVLSELAKTNPARAWAIADGLIKQPNSWSWTGVSSELRSACFENWIKLDVEAATAAATSSDDRAYRLFAVQLAALAPEKCRSLLRSSGKERALVLLKAIAETNRAAAVAEARRLFADPSYRSDTDLLDDYPELTGELTVDELERLATRTGAVGLFPGDDGTNIDLPLAVRRRIYEEIDTAREDPDFLFGLALAWAGEDPRGGLRWLETLDRDQQALLLPSMLSHWKENNPSDASDYFLALPDSQFELAYRFADDTKIGESYVSDELAQRVDVWYTNLSEAERRVLAGKFPSAALDRDPEQVFKWSIGREAELAAGADERPRSESPYPGESEVEWLPYFRRAGFEEWVSREREQALAWLSGGTDLETRDSVLETLTFGEQLPVFELMNQISDPVRRRAAMENLVTNNQPSDSQRQLDEAKIPGSLRADLQELLDTQVPSDDPFFGL